MTVIQHFSLSPLQWTNIQIMLEALLAGHLVALKLQKRSHFWIRIVLTSLFSCILVASIPADQLAVPSTLIVGILLYSCALLVLTVALYTCYRETAWTVLFCAVAGYTIQHLLSAVNTLAQRAGVYDTLSAALPSLPGMRTLAYLILLLAVYLACFSTVCRPARTLGHIMVENRSMIVLTIVAACADIVLSFYVFQLSLGHPSSPFGIVLALYDIVLSALLLYMLFELAINRSLKERTSTIERLLDEQRQQYALSADIIERVNIKSHNLKHQLSTTQSLQNVLHDYESVYQTGSSALDLLLSQKHAEIENLAVDFSCMADGLALSTLADDDVYALCGNVLDNALHALRGVPDASERLLIFTVKTQGKILLIHEENPFVGSLIYADGLPLTTQENSDYSHGFGTASIRRIVENYGGTLHLHDEDGWFYVDITIPLVSTHPTNSTHMRKAHV